MTLLALAGFPQTIMPNPLVGEMTVLAAQAGLPLPLTEEVAADIFTGTFTGKWAVPPRPRAGLLDGTLYARYYDLPAPQAWPERSAGMVSLEQGKNTAEDFTALCRARAAEARAPASGAARRRQRDHPGAGADPHHPQPRPPDRCPRTCATQSPRLAPELADQAFAW